MAGMDGEVFPHKRDLTSDHHITCKESIKEEDAVAMEVPAGGVVFFNCNVPHSTKANETEPRAAVAYHFVNMEVAKDREFSRTNDWQGGGFGKADGMEDNCFSQVLAS